MLEHSRRLCAKWLNQSRCFLGGGLGKPEEGCVTCGAHWRNLASTIEPSVRRRCGLFINYFDHLLPFYQNFVVHVVQSVGCVCLCL